MSSTNLHVNVRLLTLLALLAALLAGCSSAPKKDSAEFDLPDSVTVELGDEGEAEAAKTGEAETTAAPAGDKPTVSDADSAAVLQRLKAQSAAPAITARDPDHEKQAQKAKSDYDRALMEMKKGNLDAALSQFRQIAAQYPALAGPIVNQAIILRKKGQLEAAHKLLQDSLLTHGRNPYLLNELGAISRQLGQFKKAQASYESAIRIDPQYAKAHYNLGVLADLYLHDAPLALQEFKQYQSLIPEPDKKVEGWIKDLERRTAKSTP